MVKKGNRPAKANQQRAKQEQWKRRIASQAESSGVTSVMESEEAFEDGVGSEVALVAATPTAASTTARPVPGARPSQARAQSPATAGAAQRRATAALRANRSRLAANVLSVEDEMHYVRVDIRRLIILTALCLAVLALLFFLIPR